MIDTIKVGRQSNVENFPRNQLLPTQCNLYASPQNVNNKNSIKSPSFNFRYFAVPGQFGHVEVILDIEEWTEWSFHLDFFAVSFLIKLW